MLILKNFALNIIICSMTKKYEAPEFQVIRQIEASAKFFVASGGGSMSGVTIQTTAVSSYSSGSLGGAWE